MRVHHRPRAAWLAAAVFLAEWQLPAQPPPGPQAQTKPEDLCSIEGMVTNAATGEALKKAGVAVTKGGFTSPDRLTTTTDGTGRYQVSAVPPGSYTVLAEHPGFRMTAFGSRSAPAQGTTLVLTPGQKATGVDVKLLPYGVLAGKVVDVDGEGVPGVAVSALRMQYENGRKQLTEVSIGTTNDLGEYRLYKMDPGRYYVRAARRPAVAGQDRSAHPPREGYAPTYYPGTPDVQGAIPVEVAAGQTQTAAIKLARTPITSIRGRIVNQSGAPNTSISVALKLSGVLRAQNIPASVAPDGQFEFRAVPSGHYYVQAQVGAQGPLTHGPQVQREVEARGEPIEGVVLTLIPLFDIAGSVRVEEGEIPDLRAALLYLSPPVMSDFLEAASLLSTARVSGDGSFTLKGLSPNTYVLTFGELPEGYYLKAAKIGEVDVLEKDAELSGPPGAPLLLTLSAKAGAIAGAVKDENGGAAGGAIVALVPEGAGRREQARLYHTKTTDQYGRFKLTGLAPGDYRLFAFSQLDGGALRDPEFLKPIESKGVRVTVREGGSENADINLIPSVEAPR
jgi:protocatechuate 3,4-dioxygenase beta subunit